MILSVENFNTTLISIDRFSQQKINKETVILNDTLDQMDSVGIFRALDPKAAEYNFFTSTHGTIFKIDHMLGHKNVSTNSSIFSYYSSMKLEINHKKKLKSTQMQRE